MDYQTMIVFAISCVVGVLFLFLAFRKNKNRLVTLFWGGELTLLGGIVLLSNKNAEFMKLFGLLIIILGILLSIIATLKNFPEE